MVRLGPRRGNLHFITGDFLLQIIPLDNRQMMAFHKIQKMVLSPCTLSRDRFDSQSHRLSSQNEYLTIIRP